jgi:hypothetical protein
MSAEVPPPPLPRARFSVSRACRGVPEEPRLTDPSGAGILTHMGSVGKMRKMTLYPKMVPSVGLEWLDPSDLELLGRLARAGLPPDDGLLESVVTPRVAELSGLGFVVLETGANYSGRVRRLILDRWADAGAGVGLLSMIAACQEQLMPRLSLERGGMVPELRSPARVGRVGVGKLTRREVRSLLESLKALHGEHWPLEQLANVVRPYARATRRRG